MLEYYLIIFNSSNTAIKYEMELEEYDIRVVPIHPKVKEGCGYALKVKKEDLQKITNRLNDEHRVYHIKDDEVEELNDISR